MEKITVYTSASVVNSGAYSREDLSWDELKKRLMSFKRTGETFAQYESWRKASDPRAKQAKDQGCFVGALLKDGMRRHECYLGSTLISLDIDEGSRELLGRARQAKFEAVVYTTHSSSEGQIRFRMVVPLSKVLTEDEWSRAIHAIAGQLGISNVDSTCLKDCVHAMYWPSASSDGMAEAYDTDQQFLDIDALLKAYPDLASCPSQPGETADDGAPEVSDLEDPSLKPWPVGPFCAAYDIPEAISKFIPGSYRRFSSSRYTLTFDGQPHEQGGLRLYLKSDRLQIAKAENESDPANTNGHDVNAFDLVRIHRFGRLDAGTSIKTPVAKRPSYRAMSELCEKDEAVKARRDEQIREAAYLAYEKAGISIPKAGNDKSNNENKSNGKEGMMERMKEQSDRLSAVSPSAEVPVVLKFDLVNKFGKPLPTRDNILYILRNDSALDGAFAFNEFTRQVSVLKPLPWDRGRKIDPYTVWNDDDDAGLRWYLETMPQYGIDDGAKISDAFAIVSRERSFNPVKDFIESKPWDGKKRLETMLITYLGCEDTRYCRWLSDLIGEAGIARIYQPGIAFDTMPVLVGRQGCGKSQFCQKLGYRWFTDSIGDITNKDALQSLDGNWIVEFSELKAFNKADAESYKQFLSSKVDKYRKAYDRRVSFNPRQCIFIGTTNDPVFLKNDSSGYRRFLPIRINGSRSGRDAQRGLTPDVVQQIWAEALELYRSDVELDSLSINEVPDDLIEEVKAEREKAVNVSALETQIREWLDAPVPDYYYQKDLRDRLRWLGYSDLKDDPGVLENDMQRKADIASNPKCIVEPRAKTCILEIYRECVAHRDAMPSPMEENAIMSVMKKLVDEGGWEIVSGTMRLSGSVYPVGRNYFRRSSKM